MLVGDGLAEDMGPLEMLEGGVELAACLGRVGGAEFSLHAGLDAKGEGVHGCSGGWFQCTDCSRLPPCGLERKG